MPVQFSKSIMTMRYKFFYNKISFFAEKGEQRSFILASQFVSQKGSIRGQKMHKKIKSPFTISVWMEFQAHSKKGIGGLSLRGVRNLSWEAYE